MSMKSVHPYGAIRAAAAAQKMPLTKVQKKQVKKIIKAKEQLFFHSVNGSDQSLDWSGALISISSPAQSLSDAGRQGDTIFCTSLKINYNLSNPSTGTDSRTLEQLVRVLVVRWLPFDATPPVLGDILNITSSRSAVFSQYNDDKREQFNVLYDKMHQVHSRQLGASNPKNYAFDVSVKCNQKIEFNAGTTNGTSKLYMIFVSNVDVLATSVDKLRYDYLTNLRYTN